MALNFDSAGSARRVDFGSAANLDNLARGASGMSIWMWVKRTTNGGNQHLVTKDGAGTTGFNFVCDNAPVEGSVRFIVFRASPTDFVTSGTILALNTWTYIALTFDDALATEADMYSGSLSVIATETAYSTSTSGSGTPTDDASINLYVGNLPRSTTLPFLGVIARGGVLNRRLTLAEIQQLQFASLAEANISGTVLLYDLQGTGTQPDYSGNGNAGTVTSATAADHAPLIYYR